jgi:hypothetical protein
MILLSREHVKPRLGLFAQSLGPVVAGRDFQVEAANIAAVVLVLDGRSGMGIFPFTTFRSNWFAMKMRS